MQERVVREIRMLRAMWRVLETEPRTFLNGHEGGNAGYSQGVSYGSPRQRSTLPGERLWDVRLGVSVSAGPMTYAVGGEQYLSIQAGHTLFTFGLRD